MANNAVAVRELTKVYRIYERPIDRLKESLSLNNRKLHKEFYAVDKLTFELTKGEAIGIIGKNGSGKSTLLKLISGVLTPTSGEIVVRGKVSALLELGAGFNPEMTGIENIYLNGMIMGYSKKEIDAKLHTILDFADIGDFALQPVKLYSSGMFARLAFALAINVEPEILIVDETLAVGDVRFQAKCFNSLKALREKGVTVLFVSHDVHLVRNLCKKTLWLDQGKMVKYGDTVDVTAAYLEFMYSEKQDALLTNQPGDKELDDQNPEFQCSFEPINRWGSNTGIISFAKMYNESGTPSEIFNVGEKMSVVVAFNVPEEINLEFLSVAFSIKNNLGIDLIVGTTYDQEVPITFIQQGKRIKVRFQFVNCLNKGDYILNIALEDRMNEVPQYYDYIEGAGFFKSVTDKKIFGMISVPVIQDIFYIGD